MSGVSSSPRQPPSIARRRLDQHFPDGLIPAFAALLIAYLVLAGYLYCPIPFDGDGAAYTLQALSGSPWERSVHVGYLAPLWVWTRATGRDPALLSALWTGCGLALATTLGARLTVQAGRSTPKLAPLLAPLAMLGAAATWRAGLSVEVYGPLATLLLGATLALSHDRWSLAGGLLGLALLVHPVAWALVPGLALLAGGGRRETVQALGVAAALQLIVLALLWPDWWSGGRGLLGTAAADRSPWQSLQGGWRLLAADLGPASVVLLAGLVFATRRQLAGLALVVLGAAVLLDRHSDNPGQLPSLWLLCCFAPLAAGWLAELRTTSLRRVAAAGAVALLLLGVAEATSRHDGEARSAVRDAEALLAEGCDQAPLPWPEAMKLELLCRGEAAGSAR